MRKLKVGLLCASVLIGAVAGSASAVEYRMRDLGIFAGADSWAMDINNSGQVICNTVTAMPHNSQAYVWHDGELRSINDGGVASVWVRGINDSGQVVGTAGSLDGFEYGFLWQNNVMQNLNATVGQAIGPVAINNNGEILGSNSNGEFFLQGATLQGLDRMMARALNDKRQVVGLVGTKISTTQIGPDRAVIWGNGVMQELATPAGHWSGARAINNSGQVVGQAYYENRGVSANYAVLWQNGTMQELGTLGTFSDALDINNLGQIVGFSGTSDGYKHAFVWQNGIMQDLSAPGACDSQATAINDLGQIVGYTYTPTGEQHAVLWEPVPEPSSILALITGLAGIGGVVIRRRK